MAGPAWLLAARPAVCEEGGGSEANPTWRRSKAYAEAASLP